MSSDVEDLLARLSPAQRRLLEQRLRNRSAADEVRRPNPEAAVDPDRLSRIQRRLWFMHQLHGETAPFTIPFCFRLAGHVDTQRLRRAVNDVIAMHPILATRIHEDDTGEPRSLSSSAHPEPRFIDLSQMSSLDRAQEVRRLRDLCATTPIPAGADHLFEMTVVRCSGHEHLLLARAHHMVFDGPSAGIFLQDLADTYAGSGIANGDPRRGYASFASGEQDSVLAANEEVRLAHWEQVLEGATDLDIPGGRQRTARPTFAGAGHPFTLDVETTKGIRELARACGASSFMVVLAALDLLLSRLSGQDDVVVGIPLAVRPPGYEATIGPFVNTLPVRVRIVEDATFTDLVGHARSATIDMLSNQVPYERLVERLAPRRDLQRQPFLQVAFQLLEDPAAAASIDGVHVEQVEDVRDVGEFELAFNLVDDGTSIRGTIEYWTERYEPETVARFAHELSTLLGGLVRHPHAPLSQISQRTSQEQDLLWRAGRPAPPEDSALDHVHRRFEEQALQTPDAVALRTDGSETTYRELDEIATRLAKRLVEASVAPGDNVAFACADVSDAIPAMLAILKAGAAYVPLDVALPAPRLSRMLDMADVRIVIGDPAAASIVGAIGNRVLLPLSDGAPTGSEKLLASLAPALAPPTSHPAYVMYTSGSTGDPKGVVVTHIGVTSLALRPSYVDIGPGDVLLQLAPLAFDASTFEIWGALLNGATLALAPTARASLDDLAGLIDRLGVSVLHLTAGLFRAVADERPQMLASLRELLTGGDVVSPAHVARVLERFPDLRVTACYGPTEATTFVSTHAMTSSDRPTGRVPIGRPIPGRTMHVLDDRLRLASPGVEGDLYVGGLGVASGYLDDPLGTARSFVPSVDPGEAPGARMYRTGDRASTRADGTIDFLGRSDDQVKVRGFRIDPAEVEAALASHDHVRQSVVVVEPDAADKRLVGYVELHTGAARDVQSLRAHLERVLPEYMVPAVVAVVDRIPISTNGKVDRVALASLARTTATTPSGVQRSWTASEQQVVDIWRELLGVEEARPDDNFFEVGGHSLLATRFVARIGTHLGLELPLRIVFERQRLGDLISYLGTLTRADAPSPSILPATRSGSVSMRQGLAGMTEQERSALLKKLGPTRGKGSP